MAIETKPAAIPSQIDPNDPGQTGESPNITYRGLPVKCPNCQREGLIGFGVLFTLQHVGGHSGYVWCLGCADESECWECFDEANGLAPSLLAY